ncbi:MAG: winged helix-turn-helix domain-containing protein [Acetobacteraceae bacterium]|nr:winged helix-turn-helix domain-containing protein [Acetobacteraceae bacterium]
MNQKLEAGEFRRAADAQRWLAEEGGLQVKLVTVYKYLKKAGARLKVPRPCHEKKDRWAAEAFREALDVYLGALDLPADRPVRLWVADSDAVRPAARHPPGVEFAGHPARLPGEPPL